MIGLGYIGHLMEILCELRHSQECEILSERMSEALEAAAVQRCFEQAVQPALDAQEFRATDGGSPAGGSGRPFLGLWCARPS